jgi:hypothetical protein
MRALNKYAKEKRAQAIQATPAAFIQRYTPIWYTRLRVVSRPVQLVSPDVGFLGRTCAAFNE